MTHTPAPWDFESVTGYIKNNEGDIIGDVSVSEDIDYKTAKANGVLQAAAPELLEALEECQEHISRQKKGDATIWSATTMLKKVDAAIAKAKGES